MRKGFVLNMWTGVFEGEDGLPLVFPSRKAAVAELRRYPAWGRQAVRVLPVKVKGPNYIVGTR